MQIYICVDKTSAVWLVISQFLLIVIFTLRKHCSGDIDTDDNIKLRGSHFSDGHKSLRKNIKDEKMVTLSNSITNSNTTLMCRCPAWTKQRALAFFVCALTHTINFSFLKARPLARLITASNTKHCSFSLPPPLQARNWNHELLHLLGAPERRSSFYSRARKARLDYPALHRKRTRCFSGKSPRSLPITIFKGMAALQDPFGWHLEVALLLQYCCRLHHQILKNSQSTPVFWTWHQGRVTLTCPPVPLLQSLPHRLFVSALVHPSQVQATSLRHASSLRHSIPRISLQYASSLRQSIPPNATPIRVEFCNNLWSCSDAAVWG